MHQNTLCSKTLILLRQEFMPSESAVENRSPTMSLYCSNFDSSHFKAAFLQALILLKHKLTFHIGIYNNFMLNIKSLSERKCLNHEYGQWLVRCNQIDKKCQKSLVGGRPALAMLIEQAGVRPILAMSSSKFGGCSAGNCDVNRASGRSAAGTCDVNRASGQSFGQYLRC